MGAGERNARVCLCLCVRVYVCVQPERTCKRRGISNGVPFGISESARRGISDSVHTGISYAQAFQMVCKQACWTVGR